MLRDILSPQEHRIAVMISEGMLGKQIGGAIDRTPGGIKEVVYRIYKKLGLTCSGRNNRVLVARLVWEDQKKEEK